MTKPNYIDQCLRRAEMATPGPWKMLTESSDTGLMQEGDVIEPGGCKVFIPCAVGEITRPELCIYMAKQNSRFMAHARTDVPELARRLNSTVSFLRRKAVELRKIDNFNSLFLADELSDFSDELEAGIDGK